PQFSPLSLHDALPISVDSPTVAANFDDQPLLANSSSSPSPVPSPRRINSFLPAAAASGNFAGLFPVSVTYTTSPAPFTAPNPARDRKSTRLNSSHLGI